jgi:hypothetical protein
MFKRKIALIGFAVGGMTLIAALVSHADFVDHFNNGQVTDSGSTRGFWTVQNYSGDDIGSSITEPPGGPLKLSYSGDPSGRAGPRLCSQLSPEFDFFAHPVSLAITAAPNSTLTPVKPASSDNAINDTDRAWTYLGLTGTSGQALTDGPNRVILQLSSRNWLQFNIKDSQNKLLYTLAVFDIPHDAVVKKMAIYLDGTDETNGNFYVNFGVQYVDGNAAPVTYSRFDTPFNLGGHDNNGARKTQSQLDEFKAGFSGGASTVIELLNISQ